MELEHVPSRNHSHGAGKLNQSLLTPSEVARWLGVSAGWVRDHATRKEPRIPSVRLGKLMRFRPSDIEEFIGVWCQSQQSK